MTYDDVMMKTGVLFAILLACGVVGWLVPMLALPAAIIALVLGLVNAFKKEPSKALIIGYAAFEGVFLGGISGMFESMYPGIVVQAVLATLSVFGVMLALFKFKGVRYGSKMMKFMMIASAATRSSRSSTSSSPCSRLGVPQHRDLRNPSESSSASSPPCSQR